MSLEGARSIAFDHILFAKDQSDEALAVVKFEDWLRELKLWEIGETFERAFGENRMCVRSAPIEGGEQKKQSYTPAPKSVRTADDVSIRPGLPDVKLFLNPDNFLLKKKNELGLHDVSAVLLARDKPISKQVFPKVGRQPLFIPIPHEKDLLLFYCIEDLAKKNRKGLVYEFYRKARARLTRIKYGSEEDMKTTFVKFIDENKRVHYRYGDAHETAGPVDPKILRERRMNALYYQSRVLTGNITDNNEVTVKIRQHDGAWPQGAVPGPVSKKALGALPYDVPANHFLMVGFDGKFKGLVDDSGKLVKV